MVAYLEEDSVSGRNALEHVTGDVLDVGAGRSIGHDVREIQHAALDAGERLRDGLGGAAEPSGDVDQRGQPSEDVAALLDDDVHDEAAVGDHAVVEERAEGRVAAGQVPRLLPVRHLEEGRRLLRQLLPLLEPRAEAEERGHEGSVEHHCQERAHARRADQECRRETVGGVHATPYPSLSIAISS